MSGHTMVDLDLDTSALEGAAYAYSAHARRTHDAAHTPVAHEVIGAELVACTLGARRRPELETTPAARLGSAFAHMADTIRQAMDRARPGLERAARQLAEVVEREHLHVRPETKALAAELAAYRYPGALPNPSAGITGHGT